MNTDRLKSFTFTIKKGKTKLVKVSAANQEEAFKTMRFLMEMESHPSYSVWTPKKDEEYKNKLLHRTVIPVREFNTEFSLLSEEP